MRWPKSMANPFLTLVSEQSASDSFLMMPPYPIYCFSSRCGKHAVYKIAARWSDGATEELKTYALCCDGCLAEWYERSLHKQALCRRAAGETLEPPGVYKLARGTRDRKLERLIELEINLSGQTADAKSTSTGERPV